MPPQRSAPALELQGVTKRYHALRPLRIDSLTIAQGERVSIGGVEAGASELLVNLITGASLPDTGEIRAFGRRTADVADADEWLASLDSFGIVSPRAVLLEEATLQQNLAMPFTLEIDPVAPGVIERVRLLAAACGIDPDRWLHVTPRNLPADLRMRAHLARARALEPRFIIVEHPTVDVEDAAARQLLAADMRRACAEAGAATLILTNDDAFARAVAPRNLKLHGATGELRRLTKGWLTW